MLYQRQRQRWLSRGQRFNYQVMLSQFQFLLRNLMKMKMKDPHMILLPQVHMIIQFHCLLLHQHRLRQVTLRSQRNSSLHKEHQNWYHHDMMMMMKQNHMKQTTLLFWTEDDIAQLQEEDVDTEPYTSDQLSFCQCWWYCFCSFRTQGPSCTWVWFIRCYWIQTVWTVSCQEWKEAAKGRISYHSRSFEKVC